MANDKIIKLSPVFKHVIWGGNKLRTDFGYNEPGDDIGECWAISAHKNGDCLVDGGTFAGMKLSEVWKNYPEIFGRSKVKSNNTIYGDDNGIIESNDNSSIIESNSERNCNTKCFNGESDDVFPLLVKIIDAKDDLSIQVHPDNAYAAKNENGSLGKMECWYIIDCEPNTSIIIGHNCKTRDELNDCIINDKWNNLIREIPVHKGDFFQIDPGTVHAIKGGTMILETQQSSDITYRLYDYDRLSNGKKRETHKDKCMDVINVPDGSKNGIKTSDNAYIERLVKTEFYNVWKVCLKEDEVKNITAGFDVPYILGSVIEGDIDVCGEEMKKGEHFIITNGNCSDVSLKGCGKVIFSSAI